MKAREDGRYRERKRDKGREGEKERGRKGERVYIYSKCTVLCLSCQSLLCVNYKLSRKHQLNVLNVSN